MNRIFDIAMHLNAKNPFFISGPVVNNVRRLLHSLQKEELMVNGAEVLQSTSDDASDTRTACFRCRGVSCDRKRPTCSRCKVKGFHCSYPEHAPTLKQLQELTTALSKRVDYFQNLLKRSNHQEQLAEQLTHQNSIFPCQKCYQSLQPCDMALPRCQRCQHNGVDCQYVHQEKPKIYHIATAVGKMNAMMDKYEQAFRKEERKQQSKTIWTVMSTKEGVTGIAHVSSYNDFMKLIDHFAQVNDSASDSRPKQHKMDKCPFAVWDAWSHPKRANLPREYPIDITEDLTNDLLDLYCRTPCCSAIRLAIIDTEEFMARRLSSQPPSRVLVYAICAMTARNAFQVHVWNKRLSPQYNMGKALSMAYCLAARELLADCFDEPSLDTCRAAILLSYCSYQNGYAGLIYYYEWIAVSMAHDLGLYENKPRTPYDEVLAWSLYYFHAISQTLRGGSASGWNPPSPAPQPPTKAHKDYYVLSTWVYKIQLQLLVEAAMACILSAQQRLSAEQLALLLRPIQRQLDGFYEKLPPEWKMDCSQTTKNSSSGRYTTNVDVVARACIREVQVQYYISRILLHFPLVNTDRSSLEICMHAAYTITCAIEASANNCNSPIIGLVFANAVYLHCLRYTNSQFALRCLKRSVDISKSTTVYAYDFEMAKTLVGHLEMIVAQACNGLNHSE
ncbi:hypothetical protein BJV82DRAFT_673937 [Fennellomyces sp. T-0311]|nr:hypothetical protein BJV82DRAFT_673937 [Fennellomyces sp. T-0311]